MGNTGKSNKINAHLEINSSLLFVIKKDHAEENSLVIQVRHQEIISLGSSSGSSTARGY